MWKMFEIVVFYFWKNHNGNIINRIVIFFFFLGCISRKVAMFKTWCKYMIFQASFCIFKTIVDNYFFQTFFVIKCALVILKSGKDLNINDKKNKRTSNWCLKQMKQMRFWPWKLWIWECVFDKSYLISFYSKHAYII
jgi:hypothetical protein